MNRLPDDTFWAARQVMAFTDEEIRAIVQTGQYSKPAEDWITATLIERRNRIGRTYFARVLPLDRIRLEGNTLAFDDLGVSSGFAQPAHLHDHLAQVRQREGRSAGGDWDGGGGAG